MPFNEFYRTRGKEKVQLYSGRLNGVYHSRHRCSMIILVGILLAVFGSACNSAGSKQYVETFNSQGKWGVGNSDDILGMVNNGFYDMTVKDNYGLYLATAGENFSDGIYEVETTQLSGPLNNGYGMLIRVDYDTDSYYVFEVSGDGFIWIGYCTDLCNEVSESLVGGGWFRSPAVRQGLLETNRLKVLAEGSRLTFFVNGIQVGRTSDSRLMEGDIAVMVETLGQGDVRVGFDNFVVTPPEG
ncbi:MAG: hypothetical protein BMS9Abin02_1143 [Anaerolineae bacterium]|nr:MAG: hypothetical protein BMS9Abin02_1143 [Anaerolineae bacterium]